MSAHLDTTALQRVLDPLAACFTPAVAQQVAALRADSTLQSRLDELADKCTEGLLTEPERVEYESYVRALDMFAILQAKARAVASGDENV